MLTKLQPKMLDNFKQSDTYLIGTGGDYASVNDALQDLSRKYMTYIQGGLEIELQMVAGHVLDEQILASAIDLSGFTLTGQDVETVIDRASTSIDFEGQKPVFGAKNAAKMLNIGQLFSMNRTGADEDKVGVYVQGSGLSLIQPQCGIKNIYGYGIIADNASTVVARESIFSSATVTAVRSDASSMVDAIQGNFSDCGDVALLARYLSTIAAYNSDCSNSFVNGIFASGGSIYATGANARKGTSNDPTDILVRYGGDIHTNAGTIGGTSQDVNVTTSNGMIYRSS